MNLEETTKWMNEYHNLWIKEHNKNNGLKERILEAHKREMKGIPNSGIDAIMIDGKIVVSGIEE